ncbi:efflux RND transporter periplasmic adaptor subunit [Vampirovibrio sp.]|uniref:efflux RND transporter periplasmic adaptor subunit n=1 Tax=Vampirovibrio sp. TaxID=2717857 RepID=UPI0035936C03
MSQPPLKKKSSNTRRIGFLAGLVILLAVFFFWNRSMQDAKPGQAGAVDPKTVPVPVELATVISRTMPVQIRTIGNVETVSTVTLKPQIEGRINGIYFEEGAFVQQGQLLFAIDTQSIEASLAQAQAIVSKDQSLVAQARANLVKNQTAVRQAQANLDKDLAQLEYARTQEKRFASLLKDEFISVDQYDQAVTARKVAEATVDSDRAAIQNAKAIVAADASTIASAQANVRADQALVESARIQLRYGKIHAPFSGRTGRLQIHVGDTVKIGDTPLIRLDRLNPIDVGFSIPEQSLKSVRTAGRTRQFPALVETRETPPSQLSGVVDFLDSTVDTNTGTIRMKARFENAERKLWPGQFVDVVLNLAQQPNAVVIPTQALQSGQQGDYVYVAVNGKAEMRPVVMDRTVKNLTVIRSGLAAGEQVVTDGQFQLSNGSLLKVKSGLNVKSESSKPAAAPSAPEGN